MNLFGVYFILYYMRLSQVGIGFIIVSIIFPDLFFRLVFLPISPFLIQQGGPDKNTVEKIVCFHQQYYL